MDSQKLKRALDAELKRHGFVRKSSTWYLKEGDVIKVVNLQKSSFSNSYYLNLDIFFRPLGKPNIDFPKEDECHVRTRLSRELGKSEVDYTYLFELGTANQHSADEEETLVACVTHGILPQLDRIKSRDGILAIASENPVILNMLPIKVKEWLRL